jgi:hypothetical protein
MYPDGYTYVNRQNPSKHQCFYLPWHNSMIAVQLCKRNKVSHEMRGLLWGSKLSVGNTQTGSLKQHFFLDKLHIKLYQIY